MKSNEFDKALIVFVFLCLLGAWMFEMHHFTQDNQNLEFIRQIIGQVLAALLTLLVAKQVMRIPDPPSNGTGDGVVPPPAAQEAPVPPAAHQP